VTASSEDYTSCELCAWRCRVDRSAGELGVCRLALPVVASCALHPAPPESFTVFMAGCNFRCLHCQNWTIAQYPDSREAVEGWLDPGELARQGVRAIESARGQLMGADRLFFSGGEPTCSLPYVEAVVAAARRLDPAVKVNFDTNGFATAESFARILALATSVTFDIRAVDDEVHRAMTGAPAAPVLANAATMARHPEKLWEFRVLVVPQINEDEIAPICRLLASLDPDLPVAFLAFRPNFALERHPGASLELMRWAVRTARGAGLRNVEWHGRPGLPGRPLGRRNERYRTPGGQVAGAYAAELGCRTHPRLCGVCASRLVCKLRRYRPARAC
jgi:pyruvate formate lyase activating enzyme